MNNDQLLGYFGHHKCASTWIGNIIRNACACIGMKYGVVSDSEAFDHNLQKFVTESRIGFVAYTNANLKYVEKLHNFRGFHVIRDPRDIIVSGYFSHLHSHSAQNWPELVERRNRLQSVSKEEGLLLEMEYGERELQDLNNWNYSQPNVLEIKMEQLIQKPYEGFVEIFRFLDLVDEGLWSGGWSLSRQLHLLLAAIGNKRFVPFSYKLKKIPIETLLFTVFDNRFSKLAKGRKPGHEDVQSHYRKGVSGDWVNHFTEEHKKFFKERYNNLLVRLGYETGTDW